MPEQTFRLLPGTVRTMGRAVGADFILDAALVSRVHCRLTALRDGGLEVRDMDSTNGTFVNGQRVETAHLASGDRVQVGRVELVALSDNEKREEPGAESAVTDTAPRSTDSAASKRPRTTGSRR